MTDGPDTALSAQAHEGRHYEGSHDDRDAAIARYRAVRRLTEEIAAPLSAEDQQVQSMPDVSPTKWHQAHVTWFFETFLLKPGLPGYEAFHPAFVYLFNSYYEAVGPRHARPARGLLSRPPLAEIVAYQAHVDAAMERLVADSSVERWSGMAGLFELGLNHEQQHQELMLTDIKHVFSTNPLHPAYREAANRAEHHAAPELRWFGHEGGVATIGHVGNGFGFDNEFPRHRTWLEDFEIASRPVTNGEYLEFVADDGYAEARHWLSDGWATVQQQGWRSPFYWREEDGAWFDFTMDGERPLDRDAPACHLSFYEAAADGSRVGNRRPGRRAGGRKGQPAGFR